MSEPERTYRMNEATGEWELVPAREPIIKSWWSLFMVAGFLVIAFGLKAIFYFAMH